MNPTLFARIIGAGNVPKASVALENRDTRLENVPSSTHGTPTDESIHQELFRC